MQFVIIINELAIYVINSYIQNYKKNMRWNPTSKFVAVTLYRHVYSIAIISLFLTVIEMMLAMMLFLN